MEGHGEVEAIPILIRRIAEAVAPGASVVVSRPVRVSRGKLLNEKEFERHSALALRHATQDGTLLIVADADDDCPKRLREVILGFDCAKSCPVPLGLVFAKRSFENWFIAAAASLGGHRGLLNGLQAPSGDPDEIPGGAHWIERHHTENLGERKRWKYTKTIEQPKLAAAMDLSEARRSGSFDKLFRDVATLIVA